MSLLDALLLDPPRIDVWLANRNDGVLGTGTAADPYNMSVALSSGQVSITSFSFAGLLVTANSTTTSLVAGDVVQITGAADPVLNGVFTVDSVSSGAFFKFRTNTTPSVGTGATAQKVTQFRFDAVMSDPTKVGPNTCVHLGPGTVITAGFYDGISGGWQIQSGMRLVGSGMDVTILKRVNVTASKRSYAVGHELTRSTPTIQPNLADFAEVAEMTIDCNFAELITGASASAGGIRMMGNYARASRVKVVNWGNNSPGIPTFGIGLLSANITAGSPASDVAGVISCGIDSCIAVNPGSGGTGWPIALYVGPKESGTVGEGFGVAPYIRNSFVDCGALTNASFIGLEMAWCRLGVVEGNSVQNSYYGFGTISNQYNGARSLTIRGNSIRNSYFGIVVFPFVVHPQEDLQISENTIEISTDTGVASKYGIFVLHAATAVAGTVLIDRNRIRNTDGSAVPQAILVDLSPGTKLQVQENVVEAVPAAGPSPIYFNHSSNTLPYFFENRTADGILIQGRNQITGELLTELATDADDAFILSLLLRA